MDLGGLKVFTFKFCLSLCLFIQIFLLNFFASPISINFDFWERKLFYKKADCGMRVLFPKNDFRSLDFCVLLGVQLFGVLTVAIKFRFCVILGSSFTCC